MSKPFCTIMTATYNRGYLIEKLYNSLKIQSNFNFEWIVIDDGSTDNTEHIFLNKILKEDTKFNIKYYKKENGGKHRAINYAVDLAEGEVFFIVDSDDVIPVNSIEIIEYWFSTIEDKTTYAGVGGLKGYINKKNNIGKTFIGEYLDCPSNHRKENNIMGDKAEVFFTDILKKYRFPEYENESFLSEDVVWLKIASEGYVIRWFNDTIYLAEYLDDGLTHNLFNNYQANPKGFFDYLNALIHYTNIPYIRKIYYFGLFYCLTCSSGYTLSLVRKMFECKDIEIHLGIIMYRVRCLMKRRK